MKTNTIKMDNQNILAKATLIVTVMLGIISLMLFLWQHLNKEQPVLCCILMIVLMTMIIVLLFLFKTPEQVVLVPIKHNLPPQMCNDLPYALDRETQIKHIKKNLHNDCDKIWIIHGDRDQCHEPFLKCVKSIYWDQLGGRARLEEPRIIPFDCPDLSSNFNDEFIDAIWLRIKKDHYLIPKQLTDLSVLFEQHHDGPIILNTRFYTQTWKKLDKELLYKLFLTYEGICKGTTHPLILCVFVIYEQPKSYLLRRKHLKRKKRIMADLKDFEDFEVPVLENILRSDMDGWYQLPVKNNKALDCMVQNEIFFQEDQMNQIFYKDSLPMRDVADKLSQFLGVTN
jgi:hypothetical protein